MDCYICHGAIAQKEIDADTVVMLKTPKVEERVYAHKKHPGVQEEYDRQIGAKDLKK